MKTWLTVILIGLFAVISFAEEAEKVGVLSNGGEYILDKFIITVYPGTQPLDVYRSSSGIAVTGNQQIDMLCENHQVIKVEPWYPWPVKNDVLRSFVERVYVFTVIDGKDVIDFKDEFLSSKDVESSDIWDLPKLAYMPNDPAAAGQWALDKIECFGAWDLIRGDTTSSVIISINDTGVYYNHPDLQANMYINGPEDLNGNGIFDNYSEGSGGDLNYADDDGNGYPDDVVGYDLGRGDSNPAEDTPTHGTHVAGCASEVADNGIGGAGPGFAAKIHATKITNAAGQLTHGYTGMIYAADNGVHIINASWGSPSYTSNGANTVAYCHSVGVLVVGAAGNDDYWTPPYNNYPSAYTTVLAVASTDPNDHKSGFSNYNPWVDISAPGSNIYATWGTTGYSNLSGTSMSSPVVAGAVALVKAQNPDATPDFLTNSIMGAADDIDELNPQYAGMLGAGRLNIHAALGASQYPNISLIDFEITQTSDDGDGVVNPGESIDIVVILENLWQDASNTIVTLRAPDGVTVTDSVTDFGTFFGNGEIQDNGTDPFSLTFNSDAVPGEYLLSLAISADGPYSIEEELLVWLSLAQAGFPINIPDNVDSHPLVFDFNSDGQREILFGCNNARVYAIQPDGSNSPGWPVDGLDEDFSTGPAVGDIDNDGDFEVVISDESGQLFAFDHDGNSLSGFPITTGGATFATVTLADLDANGDLEIILPNFQTKNIDVYNHDGSAFMDWPFTSSMAWYCGAAVGDVDNDDVVEIIIGGFNDSLHVFNADQTEVSGFPIELDDRVWGTPVVGNIDPSDYNLEIFVVTQTGMIYLVNHDGSLVEGWPVDLDVTLKASPSLGDMDGDGTPEMAFGDNSGFLHVIDSDGTELDGFPIELETGMASASPVIGDLTGNGMADIIIANGSGETFFFGFDGSGQTLPNFPIPTVVTGQVKASPAIWDIDRDGDLEIVAFVQNSGDNFEVIDYKATAYISGIEWAAFGNDVLRGHNYVDVMVSVEDEISALPEVFNLAQNYPNPFNGSTVIRYNLSADTEISLEIYDLLGRLVSELDSGAKQAGLHEIVWHGRNDNGSEAASGIYFYKLKAGDNSSIKQMVYLR
ncbi:MAG: S8 family serine peptidase [candidate division Zixibacteria bacterium]|nr:S8 family serine peptidase [candidate division Zixibacteria bacterium]